MKTKRVLRTWTNAPETMTINGKTYRRVQMMRSYARYEDAGKSLGLARAYVDDYRKQGKDAYIVRSPDGIGVYVR